MNDNTNISDENKVKAALKFFLNNFQLKIRSKAVNF